MTTAISTTPTELRVGLQELLDLASKYAALESQIESKALELEQEDWGIEPRFSDAVRGQVGGALIDAKREHGHSDFDGMQLVESIEAALAVVDFAIERSGSDGS